MFGNGVSGSILQYERSSIMPLLVTGSEILQVKPFDFKGTP